MSDPASVSGGGFSGGVVLPSGVSAARTDEQGRIAIDLECVGCGYNLRMCDAQGRCPECGLAVGRSAVGRYLCYHEPKWVQCLAWGMNRFAVSVFTLFISGILFTLLGVMGWDEFHQELWIQIMILSTACLPCVAIAFAVLGLFRATWPDPSPVKPEAWINARRLTRMCFAGGLLMIPVLAITAVFDVAVGPYGEPGWSTMAMALLMSLMWLGLPVCLLLHARKLAVMIPRPWLGRATLALLALIGLSGLVVLVLAEDWFGWYGVAVLGYEMIWPTYTGGGYRGGYGFGWWAPGQPWYYHDDFVEFIDLAKAWSWAGLGLCVLGIVPLFFVYWKALHREAAKAKATWAASPWRGQEDGLEAHPPAG